MVCPNKFFCNSAYLNSKQHRVDRIQARVTTYIVSHVQIKYINTTICTWTAPVLIWRSVRKCILGTHASPYPNVPPPTAKPILDPLLGHRANQAKSRCLPGWWWNIVRTSKHTGGESPQKGPEKGRVFTVGHFYEILKMHNFSGRRWWVMI